MLATQIEELVALGLVFAVHVVGGVLLVWALLDGEQRAGWRRRWGWGGGDEGPRRPQPPPGPRAEVRDPLPLPLPGAEPSRVRLREPVRAGDAYPRPPRRPEHPPQPAPAPERRRPA
jgi:hypothetical protein